MQREAPAGVDSRNSLGHKLERKVSQVEELRRHYSLTWR